MLEEGLYSLAEIAITLAGFTGLLGLFRSSENSIQGELRRIFYIFLMCFAVIVGVFLPVLINIFWPATEPGWYVSAAFVGAVNLMISVWAITQFWSGSIKLALPVSSYLMAVVSGVLGLFIMAGVLEWTAGPVRGYLLVGLLWLLLYSGYIFVTTLFWGTGDRNDL